MSRYRNLPNPIYRVCVSCLSAEERTNRRAAWAGRVLLLGSAQGAEEAGHSPQGCAESRLPAPLGHCLHPKPMKVTNQRGDVTNCTPETPGAFNLGDKEPGGKFQLLS